ARAARPARPAAGRPHARRHAALPHHGHSLAARRERMRRSLLQPAGVPGGCRAGCGRARDVSSVRAVAYAGAPMSAVLVERCVEAFAPEAFVNHYGSTEIYTFT